jgi:hypothetical protein
MYISDTSPTPVFHVHSIVYETSAHIICAIHRCDHFSSYHAVSSLSSLFLINQTGLGSHTGDMEKVGGTCTNL